MMSFLRVPVAALRCAAAAAASARPPGHLVKFPAPPIACSSLAEHVGPGSQGAPLEVLGQFKGGGATTVSAVPHGRRSEGGQV